MNNIKKKCRNCGIMPDFTSRKGDDGLFVHSLYCSICGIETNFFKTKIDAFKFWNKYYGSDKQRKKGSGGAPGCGRKPKLECEQKKRYNFTLRADIAETLKIFKNKSYFVESAILDKLEQSGIELVKLK